MSWHEYCIVGTVLLYWGGAIGYFLNARPDLSIVWLLYGTCNAVLIFWTGRL